MSPSLAGRSTKRIGLPSGQVLAHELGVPQLEEKDLQLEKVEDDRVRDSLAASTPLWYWILCEAEKGHGRHLGELGALIVGEVLHGLIASDPASFLGEEPGWEPGELGGTKGDFTMASFVRFAQGGEPD